ncbi:hypothetical protein GOODEAATRI_018308 [Goodea atripinnis]|uniref:Uncharacterized protein n=1 Tax=Goodea atripinnis TaxID=208336 RepID=A0ABV0NL86_9TELE
MGTLGAGSALGMGGIVGALNGVIQAPAGPGSPHTTGAATGVTLPDQQQQALLLQLIQQQKQHQDLQQLQSLSSTTQIPSMPLSNAQLPITNLLPSTQGQGAIAANPFLALQHAHTDTHGPGAGKPRVAEKAVGIAGQEKT